MILRNTLHRSYRVASHFRRVISSHVRFWKNHLQLGAFFVVILANLVLYLSSNNVNVTNRISIKDAHWFLQNPNLDTGATLIHSKTIGTTTNNSSDSSMSFDPRLMPALTIHAIVKSLQSGGLNPNIRLPFSWSSWLEVEESTVSVSCDWIPSNYSSSCSESGTTSVIGPIDTEMSQERRRAVGTDYLLHSAPAPQRIVFLGIGSNRSALVVPLDADSSDLDQLLQLHQERGHICIHDELASLNTFWDSAAPSVTSVPEFQLKTDIFRAVDPSITTDLSQKDFIFDEVEYYKSLVKSDDSDLDSQALQILDSLSANHTKYFHEALILKDSRGHHYDWRFFETLDFTDYERKAILHRLSRAWLRYSNSVGVVSWLAHGSLLGWHWNGMNMPWDSDLDVQVTMESLLLMARNYNQSIVVDLTDSNSSSLGTGSYFLDVGPSYTSRKRGNGLNTIDARFIDTSTGFYVDITAVSHSEDALDEPHSLQESRELNQVLDPEYVIKERSQTIVKEDLELELKAVQTSLSKNKLLFNCRNHHYYTLEDLHPLKAVLFEGITALVPNEYHRILQREYSHGLWSRRHAGHTYRPVLDLWVPSKICKKDLLGKTCTHQDTLIEANHTREFTRSHRERRQKRNWVAPGPELEPFRVDPWIVQHAMKIAKV